MMGILIRKEVLTHLLSYRFILTFSLFFVLVVSSVQIIAMNYSRQADNYAESRRAVEAIGIDSEPDQHQRMPSRRRKTHL